MTMFVAPGPRVRRPRLTEGQAQSLGEAIRLIETGRPSSATIILRTLLTDSGRRPPLPVVVNGREPMKRPR